MKTPKPSASRDTTVRVTKYTEVDGSGYRGGSYVVASAVAKKLVESGNAAILQSEKREEPKTPTKPTGDVAAEGES